MKRRGRKKQNIQEKKWAWKGCRFFPRLVVKIVETVLQWSMVGEPMLTGRESDANFFLFILVWKIAASIIVIREGIVVVKVLLLVVDSMCRRKKRIFRDMGRRCLMIRRRLGVCIVMGMVIRSGKRVASWGTSSRSQTTAPTPTPSHRRYRQPPIHNCLRHRFRRSCRCRHNRRDCTQSSHRYPLPHNPSRAHIHLLLIQIPSDALHTDELRQLSVALAPARRAASGSEQGTCVCWIVLVKSGRWASGPDIGTHARILPIIPQSLFAAPRIGCWAGHHDARWGSIDELSRLGRL